MYLKYSYFFFLFLFLFYFYRFLFFHTSYVSFFILTISLHPLPYFQFPISVLVFFFAPPFPYFISIPFSFLLSFSVHHNSHHSFSTLHIKYAKFHFPSNKYPSPSINPSTTFLVNLRATSKSRLIVTKPASSTLQHLSKI